MFTPSLLHLQIARSAELDHPALDSRRNFGLRRRRAVAPAAARTIVIRSAGERDSEPLARLELLDGRRLPAGERILAEADGQVVAAADVRSGRAIADPFAASAGILELLRIRLDQVRSARALS